MLQLPPSKVKGQAVKPPPSLEAKRSKEKEAEQAAEKAEKAARRKKDAAQRQENVAREAEAAQEAEEEERRVAAQKDAQRRAKEQRAVNKKGEAKGEAKREAAKRARGGEDADDEGGGGEDEEEDESLSPLPPPPPRKAVVKPTLPHGWKSTTDADGTIYYYNKASGQPAQYEFPGVEVPDSPPLPPPKKVAKLATGEQNAVGSVQVPSAAGSSQGTGGERAAKYLAEQRLVQLARLRGMLAVTSDEKAKSQLMGDISALELQVAMGGI